ncbi:hypothetical protein MBT84_15715 [Streptomyces sp. MBT84]|uniref:hypothetical protein n=1 Tax=unclassified Streptomyces TaxID=2593676 RepID=UPI000740F899|nr:MULTISPECIES: hypothetical protein [unclassified Streptomyces]KUJ41864.1 hypothetical protein ADL25_15670 [Streptomyces sp. NRRL F-5122]MBW8701048.1 hypothetical protein [Streptomyces sp. MBT84]MDX3260384.1 hypothetical protein [Streptomyces sp. MI02-2A]REE63204.1 hypothetical protein BX257_5842 [Streptomyces sp. 3212.3]
MFLEALGSAVLGLALAWFATHRLPHRLPPRLLVVPTGVAGALFGAFVTHSAVGAGSLLVILLGALVVSAASLSLLLRPAERFRRRSATA